MGNIRLFLWIAVVTAISYVAPNSAQNALSEGQIRSVSVGSDCQCSCILKPVDLGPCPRRPRRRNVRYTVDTVSGGSDCRCSCFAPVPTDTCQLPKESDDTDASPIVSRDFKSTYRAITSSDRKIIQSRLKTIENALRQLEKTLLGDNIDVSSPSNPSKVGEISTIKDAHNTTKVELGTIRNKTSEQQINRNKPVDNDIPPEGNRTTNESQPLENNDSIYDFLDQFELFHSNTTTGDTDLVTNALKTTAETPVTTNPETNQLKVSEEDSNMPLVHPPVVNPGHADKVTPGVKPPKHKPTISPGTHNEGAAQRTSPVVFTVVNTTSESVMTTTDVTPLRLSTLTLSTDALTQSTTQYSTKAESMPKTVANVSTGQPVKNSTFTNGRVHFIPYRDHDFDVISADQDDAKTGDALTEDKYSYEYDDDKEVVNTPQSSLVSGTEVKKGVDEFDVGTHKRSTTSSSVHVTTAPALATEINTTRNKTTQSTKTEVSPTTSSSTSLDHQQITSFQSKNADAMLTTSSTTYSTTGTPTTTASGGSVTRIESGDGDLKSSYYSTVDDDENIYPTDEDDVYFDYEEETTTVATTTTASPPEARCGTLYNLSVPHLIHDFGRREGNWLVDPLAAGVMRGKIYVTNFYYGNTLIEFDSMAKFKKFRWSHSHMLPYSWIGTGHIVYNGSFYYNRAFSRNIIKYDLKKRFVSAWGHLRNAVYDSTTPFTWRGHTMVHMAADESGLWVIYAAYSDFGRHPNSQHYVVNKINPVDLQTIHSWRTPIRRRGISHLFIICGVVYATDRYDSRRARITHAFDTHTGVRRFLFIPFLNQFGYNVQLLYNPAEKRLYSWDKGHQVLYDINFTY